ncbi:MarR family transcriptional regulator [Nonomuraea sp. NPDC049141]|uniref:MarR family winged helix-turn-helix transcriptional regulator n=1 Tax=Nonomuraea sp. NPDC049141 TaxID=3155500 RepID=UPI0033DC286B
MSARTISDLVVQLQLLARDIELDAARRLEEAGASLLLVSVLICADATEKTQGELVELALLDRSTMVHTVNALEPDGLATREPSQKDRRARVVEVTDEGRQLVSSTQNVLDELYDARLGDAGGARLLPERRFLGHQRMPDRVRRLARLRGPAR